MTKEEALNIIKENNSQPNIGMEKAIDCLEGLISNKFSNMFEDRMNGIEWSQESRPIQTIPQDKDLMVAELPIKCKVEWSDKIAVGEEDGEIIYEEGYVLTPLSNQSFIYNKDIKGYIYGSEFKSNK